MEIEGLRTLIAFFIFILGLIVGSFLNVVIYRFNTGATLGGRSMCFSCGKTLCWYELIPVISYIAQRGKCSACKSRISLQYPLVELLTGSLFFGAFSIARDGVELIYLFVVFSLLVVIAVYDIRHKIIPDMFAYTFAGLTLVYTLCVLVIGESDIVTVGKEIISGPLYAMPFAALWLFSKGKWMGLGDAKLTLGIGWFLGFGKTYLALCAAFWIGALVGVFLIIVGRITRLSHGGEKVIMKSEIPFSPFLIIGLLVVTFWGTWITNFIYTFVFYI